MTDLSRLLESRRSRLGRWAGAAAVMCALHVGGAALALMYWPEEEVDDEAAGAMTLVLAPLPAAIRFDSPEVAHGPDQQEAKLAREASKEIVEEVAKDIPQVDPSPAPEPEVALPRPQPEEKEKLEKEEPQEAVPEKERPKDDREAIAAAPPRVDAEPAPASARSQGLSASLAREQQRWAKGVLDRLQRFKRYPDAASRRGIKGVTVVSFTVDRSGQLVASEVLQSSGSPILDEEALAVVKRASPFPVPPDAVTDAYLENRVPIWFGMKPKP